ncbi:MAG: protein phosphatase 2C domain-containing protein [Gemmatimonadota bacterium]
MPNSLLVTGRSDIGRVRKRNEDSLSLEAESGVAVVADGMGGHPGGDVASQVAAATAADRLRAASAAIEPGARYFDAMTIEVERAVIAAHAAIRQRGTEEPHLDGMGTTLTGFVADAVTRQWVIGHVGDSRAYLYRDGRLFQLTRDDTWVQQQIDNAIMDPEAARRSPYAHLLTQCLGLEDTPTPQVFTGLGEAGDVYLLCTDGLVGMLDDEEIVKILSTTDGTDVERVAALLEAANEAGGHDNITAALVRMS